MTTQLGRILVSALINFILTCNHLQELCILCLPVGTLKAGRRVVCCQCTWGAFWGQKAIDPVLAARAVDPYNKIIFMFQQLKSILEKGKAQTDESTGRALDCLKQIEHFKKIDDQLGTEYLLALMASLQPFVLRQSFGLINESDYYVLVQGDLRSEQLKYEGNRNMQPGKLINLRDNPDLRYVAWSDCNMVRIHRSLGTFNAQQKRLIELQRNKMRKFRQYQKLMLLPENRLKLDIVEKVPFFVALGEYDRYQFSLNCQLKEYHQSHITHQKSKRPNKIGYIVSGKIRITFNTEPSLKRQRGITWCLNEGDWISLQEYLWNLPLQSEGEVQTIAAIIFWIPRDLFEQKFSIKTNNDAIGRLMNLVRTKKLLFERSLGCRKKHQKQALAQLAALAQPRPQLLAKVAAMQHEQPRKHSYFSRGRFQSNKKQEIPMPDHIVHRSSYLTDNSYMLPKLNNQNNKTIVLFPQEYASSRVTGTNRKQMIRLKNQIDKTKQTEQQHHSTIDLNPQVLYKTIFEKIAYKYTNYPRETIHRRMVDAQTHQHHNLSIYNNFRIPKHRELSLKNVKTLDVLPLPQSTEDNI